MWSGTAVTRENRLLFTRYNLGNFTQAVWATAHGHFLRVTEAGGADVSRLGIHVDPIIVLFAPLWWLWPSANLLLVAQAVALALGAIPLFWLGRKHLPRQRDAALFSGAYLLCPAIATNASNSFTAVAFAVPLLLFAVWYLDEDRLLPFAVVAGAATLCQEQIGLVVGCLGLWYAWRRRKLMAGLAIAAAGVAVSAVDFLVVLRHFAGGSPFSTRYGGSVGGIAHDLLTNPLLLFQHKHASDLLAVLLVIPVLGLCFGSTILLVGAPQFLLLLLSRRSADWSPLGGNVLVFMPFIYSATLFTLARLARRKKPVVLVGYVLTASLGIGIIFGPLVAGGTVSFRNDRLASERHALSLVPSGAPVSVTTHLSVPLAARSHFDVFPILRGADWAVVDSRDDWLPELSVVRARGINIGVNDLLWEPRLMRRELRVLRRSPRWKLVYDRADIYVFRRVARS
jgi:uncharacterized membrane protein